MSYSFTRIVDLQEVPVPEEFKAVSVTVRDLETGYIVTRDKTADSSKSVLDLYQEAQRLLDKATSWSPSPGSQVIWKGVTYVALPRIRYNGEPPQIMWEPLVAVLSARTDQQLLEAWLDGEVEIL